MIPDFLEKHKQVREYNLLYVVQSRSDVTNGIYKVGVSRGLHRLKEYVKHHGDVKKEKLKGRCAGVWLVYLVGTKSKVLSSKSKSARENQEIIESYKYKPHWNEKREKDILADLKEGGFKKIRGNEWFKIENRYIPEFKKIITDTARTVTKDAPPPRRSERLNKSGPRRSTRKKPTKSDA